MSNSALLAGAVILVLGHAGALLLSVGLLKNIRPVIWFNLIVAAGVLSGLSLAANSDDSRVIWLIGLALFTLLTSAAALGGARVPPLLILTEFVIDFLISAILLAFVIFLLQATWCC